MLFRSYIDIVTTHTHTHTHTHDAYALCGGAEANPPPEQVLKLIKTKYYAELETKKQTESEMARLRERLEQRDTEQQPSQQSQQRTGKEDKKGKKSAQEVEDALKNSKRCVPDLGLLTPSCSCPIVITASCLSLSSPTVR